MTRRERQAIVVDAESRLLELRALRDLLRPDADDPAVLSELTSIASQLRAAERALGRHSELDS